MLKTHATSSCPVIITEGGAKVQHQTAKILGGLYVVSR